MDKRLMNKHFFRFCNYLFRVCLFSLYATMLYGNTLSVYALETGNSTKKTNRNAAPVVKKANRYVAPVARLEDWRFYPEALQLEMSLSAASQPRHFYLAQPPRIVIDLPGTKLGRIPTQQNFSGAIRTIRVSQLNADVTRIVMDLAPGTVINPNQVQLQPVSRENPNRWVLRPLIASNGTYLPQGNLPSLPGNLPPGMYNPPQPPGNLPPGMYNPPQPPGNLPPGMYNPPQPPGNLPTGMYNPPQPPGNLPPGMYNPPQPPGNLPPGVYNPPQASDFSVPPPLTTLPPTNTNFPQTPSVRVPPFTPNNPSQLPSSIVPPPSSPYQPRNPNNAIPSVGTPNFPVPNAPSYPPSYPNSRVIEFGDPFPNGTR
ncbi:AMIN domain-containing protein [Scytonema sp. PRP1]|uniref:AMIN domain-containing protein n=1 Tax=Scytonema sp. PRP1 TaxID=3120513 RepID=UPI002FD47B47